MTITYRDLTLTTDTLKPCVSTDIGLLSVTSSLNINKPSKLGNPSNKLIESQVSDLKEYN